MEILLKKLEFHLIKNTNCCTFTRPKNGMTYGATPSSDYPIIPIHNNWILIEPSSDTLFTFSSDLQLKPFIIRKPSIESMNPETFLFISSVTDRYCFMEIVEKNMILDYKKAFLALI